MNDIDAVRRHEALVPMGTQVSSKGRHRYCRGFGPAFIDGMEGCRVWDDQGRDYIDWTMGLGAITVGHGTWKGSIGASPPLPTTAEIHLAEKLRAWIPCAQKSRFLKTGTDATAAAVRLARAFTGRDKILRCGYHGWQDWALNADYADKKGVPQCVRELTITVPFNDIAALDDAIREHNPACFILEPISLIPPEDGYLQAVVDRCDNRHVVSIFDETITGIRMAKGGAQEVYDVTPDLCTIGKGMANGLPISAVCGNADIMDAWGETHISGTHFGDPGCIKGAIAVMDLLEKEDFWSHQQRIGRKLKIAYNVSAGTVPGNLHTMTRCIGEPHHTCIQWDDPVLHTLWQQEVLRRGVLVASSQFVSLSHHDEELQTTLDAYDEAMRIVADAVVKGDALARLECPVNTTVFRRH